MEKVTIFSFCSSFFVQVSLSLKRRGRLSSGPSEPVTNILCLGHPFGFSLLNSVMMVNALLVLSMKCSGVCYVFPDNFGNIAIKKKIIAKHSEKYDSPNKKEINFQVNVLFTCSDLVLLASLSQHNFWTCGLCLVPNCLSLFCMQSFALN